MLRLLIVLAGVAVANGGIITRVIGGQDAKIEEYPHQVALQFAGMHYCGGTLIKPDVVVTSAHCIAIIRYIHRGLTIRAGTTVWGNDKGEEVQVQDQCTHERYIWSNNNDYDISVLKLVKPVTLGSNVAVIDLQPVYEEVPVGKAGKIAGWGFTSHGGVETTNLQAVEIQKIDKKTCQNNYRFEYISPRMDCYGTPEGGKGGCFGDYGGGLVVDGKLAGITSWGYGCGGRNLPTVFTKTANWNIRRHINRCLRRFDKKA